MKPFLEALLSVLARVKRLLSIAAGSAAFYIILSFILHIIAFQAANRAVFGPADTGLDLVRDNNIIVNLLRGGKRTAPAATTASNEHAARMEEKFAVTVVKEIIEDTPVETNTAASNAMTNLASLSSNTLAMGDTNGALSNTNMMPFELGETIIYDVEVSIAEMPAVTGTVGTVTIELQDYAALNGRRVYVARAETHSLDLISDLYQLHDIFITWFDASDMRTYRIEKRVHEGQHIDSVTNLYFSDQGYGIFYHKYAPAGNRYVINDANTFDIISLLYLLRVVDKTKPLDVNWADDFGNQRKLNITYEEKGVIDVAMKGRFRRVDTIAARDTKTGITIYLAKDYGFFPVKAVIPAFKVSGYSFTLNATLKKYIPGKRGNVF
ncbi:MAG: DUF3108 domain-containing protein [Spirochaetota bacterium]